MTPPHVNDPLQRGNQIGHARMSGRHQGDPIDPLGPIPSQPKSGHQAQGPVTPRLLDLKSAATYLSVSPWTVRDLEAKGVLPRVRVPVPGSGELRKLLFDKADLDRLIDAWKDSVR
jgi:hypothetical protein